MSNKNQQKKAQLVLVVLASNITSQEKIILIPKRDYESIRDKPEVLQRDAWHENYSTVFSRTDVVEINNECEEIVGVVRIYRDKSIKKEK